jgi:tetratricopeptide (TPR) repeat protein
MSRKFVIVMLLVALFVLNISCGPNKLERTHKLLMSAREKIYMQDLDGAWEDLEKCKKIDKNNPEVYFLMGNIYMTKVQYEEAMEMYNKAIELNDSFMEAYVNRGRLWFYLGDNDKQCEDYLKAESLGASNLYEETKFCR